MTMNYFFVFFVFIMGCCIGSFLNVCIWRLPRGQSISMPRKSVCPKCNASISGYDNVPLLSFILLLGRCRHCKTKISLRYPLVEAVTGLLFAIVYWHNVFHGNMYLGEFMIIALLMSLLIASSGVDVEFFIIPDEFTLYGIIGGISAGLLLPHLHAGPAPWHTFETVAHINGLIASLIGLFVGGGIVLFFAVLGALIFRREAIGFGDVKLMAMTGSFLGWKLTLAAFAIAPFLGLLYGLPLLFVKKDHSMPFGPFISAAAVISLLFRAEAAEFLDHYIETIQILVSLAINA